MAGRDISLLVPDAVKAIMRDNAETLAACWGGDDSAMPEATR
jgi:nicotinate-nucleotide adenylyltransferase